MDKRSHHFQVRRENDKICIGSDGQSAFRFQTNCARRICCRHRDRLVQRNIDISHHCADEIDHTRSATRQCRAVGQQTDAAFHNAFITEK